MNIKGEESQKVIWKYVTGRPNPALYWWAALMGKSEKDKRS